MKKLNNRIDPIELLKELINIPSQNSIDPEQNIATFLYHLMKDMGFQCHFLSFTDNRPNLICELLLNEPGPKVIFNMHMDTKPAFPDNSYRLKWHGDPFQARISDDKIYGLGACDVKGGIASVIAAVYQFVNEPMTKKGTIALHFVCDEESTSEYGTIPLCQSGEMNADFVIVIEPTENRVSNKQLGNISLQTSFVGKGGHTGLPEGKINPFRIAFSYVEEIERWVEKKRSKSNFKQQPFINIGRFEGGTSSGTIPEECILFWGVRVLPGDRMADYLDEINKITDRFLRTLPNGCKCTTKKVGSGGIDSCCVCENKYIDIFEGIIGKERYTFPGASDAAFIWNISGIPCCVFGPGSLKQAHYPNEYVEINQLIESRDILVNFMKNTLS